MAHVEWSAGIDSVSGALAKPSKSGQHSCSKMLLGTHRVAPTENPNCNRVYIRKKTKRNTPPSESELYVRNRLAAVSRAVNTRMHDLTKVAADQAAFKAQKDTPGGKKTLRAYLWALEKAAYDASQG